MDYEMQPYGVFIKTNDAGCIVAINSDAFLADTEGWVKLCEGIGDQYHHAQSNYLSQPLTDERGICRYKLVDGNVVERTQEEMDADYTLPEPPHDLAAEVAALRESNAQLQEALELLLSGEV